MKQKAGKNAEVNVVPALVEGMVPVEVDVPRVSHVMVIGIAQLEELLRGFDVEADLTLRERLCQLEVLVVGCALAWWGS